MNGEQVKMDTNVTAKVVGIGYTKLKFTSGKMVTLFNIRYVPDLSKNLVSSDY